MSRAHLRGLRGEAHPKAKLTAAQVLEIRGIKHEGWQKIERRYGVNKNTIRAIKEGRTWKSVGPAISCETVGV